MIKHIENCLAEFLASLPVDYRDRTLSEQPDAVWGERVLPNFRTTLQNLNTAVIKLSHGDFSGLNFTYGPASDFKGQLDYWSGWMKEEDESSYRELMSQAVMMASNINTTDSANWTPYALGENFSETNNGPLAPPSQWPDYRIKGDIVVKTGDPITSAGVYYPDIEDSSAQFLSSNIQIAPPTKIIIGIKELFAPDTGLKYGERPEIIKSACHWKKVERFETSTSAGCVPTLLPENPGRVRAGEACPRAGYYFTPSRQDSRRWIDLLETMPDFSTAYGETIWQWDQNQTRS